MLIKDKNGNGRSLVWLREQFGNVEFEEPKEPAVWVVDLVQEVDDPDPEASTDTARETPEAGIAAPTALIATVVDERGRPKKGVEVVFYWQDGPEAPGTGWYEKGLVEVTDENGRAQHIMGPGAYYDPKKAQGPHAVWVAGRVPNAGVMVDGLGMIAGTNHRHLDVTFKPAAAQPPVEPKTLIRRAIRLLRQALDAMEELA